MIPMKDFVLQHMKNYLILFETEGEISANTKLGVLGMCKGQANSTPNSSNSRFIFKDEGGMLLGLYDKELQRSTEDEFCITKIYLIEYKPSVNFDAYWKVAQAINLEELKYTAPRIYEFKQNKWTLINCKTSIKDDAKEAVDEYIKSLDIDGMVKIKTILKRIGYESVDDFYNDYMSKELLIVKKKHIQHDIMCTECHAKIRLYLDESQHNEMSIAFTCKKCGGLVKGHSNIFYKEYLDD